MTDVADVEVGKHYMVHCIRLSPGASSAEKKREPSHWMSWTPVIGGEHEDFEFIRFGNNHWHHDWRFSSDVVVRDTTIDNPTVCLPLVVIVPLYSKVETSWRRRRCLRNMPAYENPKSLRWMGPLENAFGDHQLPPGCTTCPHRGLPLNGIPADQDGVVTCPGHGLSWNLATGRLVRRAGPPPPLIIRP